MIAPNSGAGFGAVLHFYEQYASLPPGSERAEVTDRAISIAICRAHRAGSNQEKFDIWRNARFSYRRSKKRQRQAHTRLKAAANTGACIAAAGGQVPANPEELLIARDLEHRLRAAAAQLHPRGVRTLVGMINGELAAETASSIEVTPRTVRRIRRAIRAEAERLAGTD